MSEVRSGLAVADEAVEDARPCSVRDRSDRGHASSKDGGGDISGSGVAGSTGGESPPAAGSDDCAAARSRSFRNEDENRRLRRCFGAEGDDGGVSGTAASRPASPRAVAREVISACQGGGDGTDWAAAEPSVS